MAEAYANTTNKWTDSHQIKQTLVLSMRHNFLLPNGNINKSTHPPKLTSTETETRQVDTADESRQLYLRAH